MKRFGKWTALVLVVLLLTTTVPALAGGRSEKAVCQETLLEVLKPGVTTMEGDVVYIKGMKELFLEECDQAWATGKNQVTINLVIYPDGTGSFTGTYRLKTFEGGLWKGEFKGAFDAANSYYRAWGSGYGLYAGYLQKVKALNGTATILRVLPGQ